MSDNFFDIVGTGTQLLSGRERNPHPDAAVA